MSLEKQIHPVEPPSFNRLRRFAVRFITVVRTVNDFLENSSNFPVVGPEYKDPTKISRRRKIYKTL